VLSVYDALSRVERFSHGDSLATRAKTNRKEFNMNQWYAKKRHVFVLMTLVGAILMGLVWLAGAPGSVRAQGTLLLNTSYKDATPRKVGAGGTVAYSIILNNDAISTTGDIIVNDPLAPELSYVGFSARVMPEGAGFGFPSGSGVSFEVNPIAPGGTVTLSFQATVATGVLPGDIITNTATISEGGLDFTRFVTVTVEDYPGVQINEPWNNQLLTNRGTFAIKGRAWTGDDPGFPDPPEIIPIVNGGGANDWYVVQWQEVSSAVQYVLQESTDMYFSTVTDEITVDAPAVSHSFSSQPRGQTYYYRAKTRTLEYESRWSAVQSVTVNPTGLLFQPLDASPVLPSVAPLAAATAPTVEVNIKKVGSSDSWQQATAITADPTGDWWNWTYNWTLPVEDDAQYIIQARAKGIGGGFDGDKIDTITVTIRNGTRYVYFPIIARRSPPIPYGTTLTIDNDDSHGNYQLSWSYTQPTDPFKPTSYIFQEATDANFTNLLFNQTATSPRPYSNKAVGTYYYRVRGRNSYGDGPWSNVQTIVVKPKGFYDNFSNPSSGWPRQVFKVDGRGVLDADYDNGFYRMKILLDTYGSNNKRMGILPAPYSHTDNSYDVEVHHWFVKAVDQTLEPTSGKAGIIFYGGRSGTGYFETPYIVEWNFEGQCSISRYLNYSNVTGHNPYVPVAWLGRDPILRNWGSCPGLQAGYDKLTRARVEMRGGYINVFFNDQYVGTYSASFAGGPHVGLVTGSWERTPVQSRFDEFRVTDR